MSNAVSSPPLLLQRNAVFIMYVMFCVLLLISSSSTTTAFVPTTATKTNRDVPAVSTTSTSSSLLRVSVLEESSTSSSSSSSSISASVKKEQEDDLVEFPPQISTRGRIERAATLWFTAVPIVLNYYNIIGKVKLTELLGNKLSIEEVEKLWNDQHEDGAAKLAETITELKGFYVKAAQIISTRQDLFPKQYTEALNGFTDNLDPMSVSLVKAVIKQELLNPKESFDDMFLEFDDEPLGAASVAQVHRAVLSEKYGGPKEVAVKVQRPSIESKLMGDIANLKAMAKTFQDMDALPIDYYTVFSELEKQLADEFNFVDEAAAMERIYNSLTRSYDGTKPTQVPVVIPRVVPGLVSRRVLVMDYLKGLPLSRAREEMERRGIDPDSPEAKLFGRKLLKALTATFGRCILETGFFHADPHPGNIFVLDDGSIGLIDYGQVKQISGRYREALAKVMIALADNEEDIDTVRELALDLGVTFKKDAKYEAPAAVAFWLFEGLRETLPGGYDNGELSPNSPLKEIESFPQDLVLAGRSTILIKALSTRLGVPWSLAKEWAPIAQEVMDVTYNKNRKGGKQASWLPAGGILSANGEKNNLQQQQQHQRVRFREVLSTFKIWGSGRANVVLRNLPRPIRSRFANIVLKIQERKLRKKLTSRK